MASASGPIRLSPDWVYSTVSNAHMCNDRRWFTTYTPFESRAGSLYFGDDNIIVAGVGTVVLPVKKSPTRTGTSAHGQLVLENVIHCPNARCNIIAAMVMKGYNVRLGNQNGRPNDAIIRAADNSLVAFFDPKSTLSLVKLSGPPVGPVVAPSVFKGQGNSINMINVRWPEDEQVRWRAHKQALDNAANNAGGSTTTRHCKTRTDDSSASNPPYTPEEKKFLKENFKNEYTFLQRYGLRIYKKEDRDEGRRMLRGFMSEDQQPDAIIGRVGIAIALNSEEDEDMDSEDLEGHMADYHFDPDALEWIEEHYGNSMDFTFSHGFEF